MQPKPAIILTDCRTGGTFLSSCLSNHPQVYWTRGEPISIHANWKPWIANRVDRLRFIFSQQYYSVAGCKLMRRQVTGGVEDYLLRLRDLKVIFLTRENTWNQALSWEVNVKTKNAHVWHDSERPKHKVTLDTEDLKRRHDYILRTVPKSRKYAHQLGDVLELTYEEMTQGKQVKAIEPIAARRLSAFLKLDDSTFKTTMLKYNVKPSEIVSNWGEVNDCIRNC